MPKRTLYIPYGQMASGKSFFAGCLSKFKSIPHLEGDNCITKKDDMTTNEGVDNFVRNRLVPTIDNELKKHNHDQIVTYAFYNRKHRQMIRERYRTMDIHVQFIHISCSLSNHIANLSKRASALWWLIFAAVAYFTAYQPPKPEDGDWEVTHKNQGEKELGEIIRTLPIRPALG